MNNLLKVIGYLVAFTAPVWYVFSMTFLGQWLNSGFILLLVLFGSAFFFVMTVKAIAEIVGGNAVLTILFTIIYVPVAIFFGFFAGWGGALAGGASP